MTICDPHLRKKLTLFSLNYNKFQFMTKFAYLSIDYALVQIYLFVKAGIPIQFLNFVKGFSSDSESGNCQAFMKAPFNPNFVVHFTRKCIQTVCTKRDAQESLTMHTLRSVALPNLVKEKVTPFNSKNRMHVLPAQYFACSYVCALDDRTRY